MWLVVAALRRPITIIVAVASAAAPSVTLIACYQRRHHFGEDIRHPRQEWRRRVGYGNARSGRR